MNLPKKSNYVRNVRAIEVLEVTSYEGEGTNESPGRLINQYYSKSGELLAVRDEWLEQEIEKSRK